MLVVADGNMGSLESTRSIVGNQISWKRPIKPKLGFIKQAGDGSNPELCLGLSKPGVDGVLRYLARRFLFHFGSWATSQLTLNCPPEHAKFPLWVVCGVGVYTLGEGHPLVLN